MEDQGRSHRSYYRRMKRYLNDFWNVVDLLSYVSLIAALCICHFHLSQKFTYARRMFSLSLLVMYPGDVLGSFPITENWDQLLL